MKNIIKLTIILLSFSAFAQSPWTQKEGKFYTQLSFTSIANYDTLFGDPDYSNFGTYTDNTIQFFGEYGLSDNTSLVLNLPLKLISIDGFEDPRVQCINCAQDFSETALGNIELGIKHNFYNKKWVLSGQFSVEANTGSYDAASGIRTGYDAWTFTPMFLAGRGFGKTYVQAFVGAHLRTNDYSSNFRIGGEVGQKLGKRIWLIGFVDFSSSFKNGDIVLPQENLFTGLYVNDQEFGAFGLKAIGEFTDNFGITAGYGGAFFGNNVARRAAITFGLYHKF